MTKNLLAHRRRLVLAKVRKLGVTGVGTSLLVTSNAAIAHGSAPAMMTSVINHPQMNAGHFTNAAANWQVHPSHTGASPFTGAIPSSAGTVHGGNLGSNGKSVQHTLINPSGFASSWSLPRQSAPATGLPTGQTLAGTELNLQSSSKNILLGGSVFQGAQSVTIRVGSQELTFTPGQKVTAAEYLAINEVISSGNQTLKLNGLGVAVGGSFALSNAGTLHVSELIIPAHVTALDNLSGQTSLTLNGDLLNYGSLYGYDATGQSDTGLISAKDIINERSGLISTQMPSSLLASIGTSLSNSNLTLSTAGDITNEGKIISGGTLSLITGSGILNNSGTVSSLTGNINISTRSPSTDLTVSANGGTFQAQNGAINLRQSDYAGSANINLVGGNYLSNALNIYAGSGAIAGNVQNLSGQINSQAGVEHLAANSANLTLGTNTVTGDPTFVNNGNITVSGVNTFSEDVTIIANGNITGTSGAEIVDSGHNVILIAGVAPGSGSPSSGTVTDKSSGISGSTTIDFASSSNKGGNVDFTAGATGTVIDTSSSTYTVGGGNVTLVAFAKGATGGDVLFNSSSTINTSASIYGSTGTNNGGNVNILAGANPTTGTVTVQVGNITTSGSNGQQQSGFIGQPIAVAGTGGSVNISTAQPTALGGTTVTFNSSGDITAGGPIIASSTINSNAQVTVGNVLTGAPGQGGPGIGGDINIVAGGNIATGGLATYGTAGAPFMAAQPPMVAHAGGNAGAVSIQSVNGGISVSGAISSAGGSGGSGGILSASGSSQAYPGAAGGNGGAVTLESATDINIAGGISTSGGAGGSGVSSNPASGGAAGGNGAAIAISTSNNGNVSISGSLLSGGGTGGNGGNGAPTSYPPPGAINGVAGSDGGSGGQIQINAGGGSVLIAGLLNSSGGAGGNGGNGFDGVANFPTSTPGGQGGNGGNGGAAGAINFQAGTVTTSGGFIATGGMGGNGGNGGDGVVGPQPSAGGYGGSGGNGGTAGAITFNAANFSGPLTAIGGNGGAAGSDGVSASGGMSGTPGTAGASANISLSAGGTTSGAITGNNISIASPAGVFLSFGDNVTASGTLSITGGATVQVTGSTTMVGTSVTINGVTGNDLTISLSDSSAAILATSGDITVTGATGNSVAVNNAGTISALNGNIYLSSTEAVVSSNAGGSITISGGGTFKVGTGVIDISTNTQSGSPGANKIEFSGNQTFNGNTILNAGGQTQLVQVDDGATVVGTSSVTVNSSTLFEIGSGTLSGNPLIINSVARGGVIANTSGTLDISSLGSLVFNGQSLAILSVGAITDNGNAVSIDLSSTSASGGNLTLLAGYNFTPNSGSLNYPPLDTTSSFVITNAGTGSISLGSTSINTSGKTSAGGILAVANGTIALGTIAANATIGAGGNVNIIGSGVTVTGNIDTTSAAAPGLGGRVSISAASPAQSGTIVVSGGFVAGGSFSAGTSSGSISVGGISAGAAPISLTANGVGAGITATNQLTAGNINLATSGAINLASNQPFALQNDAAGNGGILSLNANNLTWVGSASQALALNASAGGASGNGGSITVVLQSTTPAAIGSQAGMIELTASGGTNSGSGGAVTFNTGGNLTVSPAGINVSPGSGNSNGGQINLEAGTAGPGTLLVTGALSANGSGSGNGGTISLVSNSASIFNIGSSAKTNINGVLGALSVSGAGGTLEIINKAGGVTNAVALNSVSNLTESVGGTGILALGSSLSANKGLQTVSLTTNKGTITKSGTLTTAKIILQSTGGNIGTSSTGFSVVAGEVQASASGLVNVADTSKSDVTLDASTAGSSFKFVSSGALTINGTLTAGTAATLTTSGTNLGITINGDVTVSSASGTAALTATGKGIISQGGAGGTIQAHTLTLKSTSGTIGTPVRALDIDAGVLNLTTTGAISIANSGAGNLTINGSTTKGTFDLTSAGSIIIAKAISSATAYSLTTDSGSNGSITVNAALGGNYASSIIVDADGGGNITGSTSGKVQTKVNGSVTLTSGSGNIGAGTTSKTTLNVYTTNLSANTGGSGFVNIASKLTSAVAINSSAAGGVFDLYTAGTTTLANITSSGAGINVTETTGALTVNSSTIHAGNGSITLENVNKSAGTINIANGSKITTMSTGATGGQVSIVLGPVPTNPVAGTPPASGLTVNQVSGGSVFFGKGITVLGPVNTINLQGSNVVFNVGTRPISAITLGGGVTITADPVILPGTAQAAVSGPAMLSPHILSANQAQSAPFAVSTNAVVQILGQAPGSGVETGGTGNIALSSSNIGGLTAASGAFNGSSLSNLTSGLNAGISDNLVSSNNKALNINGQNIAYSFNEPGWLSDTELQTGEIPAVVFDGEALGIKNEISSILELEEMDSEDTASTKQTAPAVSHRPYVNVPLTGVISKNVNGDKTKVVSLRRGAVIFTPDVDMRVCTPVGEVKVAANSVAMIIAFAKGVAVYNLLDKHKDAIIIKTGQSTASVMPGAVTIICNGDVRSLQDINPTQAIGFRNVISRKVDGNMQTFSGQFSMMHALANIMPLRAMISSKNAEAKKIGSQVLKTAAILAQLNGADYQQLLRPTSTAYLH